MGLAVDEGGCLNETTFERFSSLVAFWVGPVSLITGGRVERLAPLFCPPASLLDESVMRAVLEGVMNRVSPFDPTTIGLVYLLKLCLASLAS